MKIELHEIKTFDPTNGDKIGIQIIYKSENLLGEVNYQKFEATLAVKDAEVVTRYIAFSFEENIKAIKKESKLIINGKRN